MGNHEALEVVKTVLEVADVAWAAMECHYHLRHHNNQVADEAKCSSDEELESLRSENQCLRVAPAELEASAKLYARLVATVESEEYLTRLKCLQQQRVNGGNQFPFEDATDIRDGNA